MKNPVELVRATLRADNPEATGDQVDRYVEWLEASGYLDAAKSAYRAEQEQARLLHPRPVQQGLEK